MRNSIYYAFSVGALAAGLIIYPSHKSLERQRDYQRARADELEIREFDRQRDSTRADTTSIYRIGAGVRVFLNPPNRGKVWFIVKDGDTFLYVRPWRTMDTLWEPASASGFTGSGTRRPP